MPARFANEEAIRAHQGRALRELLQRILPGNRFYQQKFHGHGIGPEIELDAFRERAPFTAKQELVEDQRAHPPFGSNLTFPLRQYIRFHQTSGTTAAPLRWLDTAESWEWMLGNWREIMVASGVGAGDRLFFAFSFGPFIGFWLAFETALRLGALCLPGGGLKSAARARVMRDNQVNVLCCTPTYALHLAEVRAAEGISPAPLQRILVAGEPGGSVPATRAQIEQAWPGAAVFDHHGMTEAGPVTYQCPERPGVLHVLEEGYIAEVIEPHSDKAVTPGSAGELVLSNLGRTGSPLLRYRTGDLVKAIQCSCGRPELALEGGILGRVDDMIIVRGVNVYPSAVEQIIRDVPGVAEYQVRVAGGGHRWPREITSVFHGANGGPVRYAPGSSVAARPGDTLSHGAAAPGALSEVTVIVEPVPGCGDTAALAKKLENAFQAILGLRVGVTVAASGSLPRFEMKARRWLKE